MGFIFKVQGFDKDPSVQHHPLINESKLRKDAFTSNFKRKSVDALNPPYQNVEALAPWYRRVEVFAPDRFNVNSFHPPQCSFDNSAPVQDSVEATAPGYFSVAAHNLAPFYSNVEVSAPECSYPDFSVEAPVPDNSSVSNTISRVYY